MTSSRFLGSEVLVVSIKQVGANLMLLNGQFVDVANLDLFSLLDRVRKEVRV